VVEWILGHSGGITGNVVRLLTRAPPYTRFWTGKNAWMPQFWRGDCGHRR
jgi:hypothetical protein